MNWPLASCITPTRGRAGWLKQAYRLWARQTYPNLEWVVVVDADDDATQGVMEALEQADERVHRLVVPAGSNSIGAKMNAGIRDVAGGDYLFCWDDDDWYGRKRAELQLMPLFARWAPGVTALPWLWQLDLRCDLLWMCRSQQGFPVGTICFRRDAWEKVGGYAEVGGYDEYWMMLDRMQAERVPVQLVDTLGEPPQFVYVRHSGNISPNVLPYGHWTTTREAPWFDAEDLSFYRGIREWMVTRGVDGLGVLPRRPWVDGVWSGPWPVGPQPLGLTVAPSAEQAQQRAHEPGA